MVDKKIHERDLEHTVLDILDSKRELNDGYVDTTTIKNEVHRKLKPSGENLKSLKDRNDTAIDQITGNIVSHRKTSNNNIIKKGYAEYSEAKSGIKLTLKGAEALETYRNEDLRNKLK